MLEQPCMCAHALLKLCRKRKIQKETMKVTQKKNNRPKDNMTMSHLTRFLVLLMDYIFQYALYVSIFQP